MNNPWPLLCCSLFCISIIIYKFTICLLLLLCSSLSDMQMKVTSPPWICRLARDLVWLLPSGALTFFSCVKELTALKAEDVGVSNPLISDRICGVSGTRASGIRRISTLALFILTYRRVEQLAGTRLQPREPLQGPLQTAACCPRSAGFCCRGCPEVWWPSAAGQCWMNC